MHYSEVLEMIKKLKGYSAVTENVSYEELENMNSIIGTYSEKYVERLNQYFGNINNGGMSEWIDYAIFVCALKLSIVLGANDCLTESELSWIVNFYTTSKLPDAVRALGVYNAASTQSATNSGLCYELQLLAFKLYPNLGEVLGVDYIYDEAEIKETYQEKCPICDGDTSTDFYCAPQFVGLNKESYFSPVKLWKKCCSCNNLYAYNFPVLQMGELNGHYKKNSKYSSIEPRYHLRIYSDIFNKCKMYTDGKKYLEIGIGNGEMLAAALEMGYEVDAVEICKEDCEKVSSVLGIDVKWCDFVNYESDKKYDIIVMGDVIEHVSRPLEALRKAKALLNRGGVLWLSTPNYNSSFTRLKKFTDPMWNERTHFTYFSYETLLPFLNEVGFEVKHYDISNRYNGSMELFCINVG